MTTQVHFCSSEDNPISQSALKAPTGTMVEEKKKLRCADVNLKEMCVCVVQLCLTLWGQNAPTKIAISEILVLVWTFFLVPMGKTAY